MKNYTYGWVLRDKGYIEVDQSAYTVAQMDMKNYINTLSNAVVAAQCGWDGVRYAVLRSTHYIYESYMVLYINGGGERWIHIDGNSKGCNLQVLGENLW